MSLTSVDQDALNHWGIQHVLSVQRAVNGVSNRVLLLETEAGSFVLRAYRPRAVERLQWEHRIIRYASEQGIPTPLPIRNGHGHSYVELDGQRYALFPAVTGQQIERGEISLREAHSMGAFLGELESRLVGFPFSEAPHPNLAAFDERGREKAATEVEELLRLIRALPERGTDEQRALDFLEVQRDWPTAQSGSFPVESNIRHVLIHGDFQQSNLFFSGSQVCAVIDWERARVAPWGWEIVRAMHLMFELNPMLSRSFLDGYKTAAPLFEDELVLASKLYGEEVNMNTWLFRAIYLEGNDRARRYLKPEVFRPFQEKWAELFQNICLSSG